MSIGLYDPATNLISFPYSVEDGQRFEDQPLEFGSGMTSRIIQTKQPIRSGSMAEAATLGAVITGDPDSTMKESFLGVPIAVGDRVLGVVNVTAEPKNAFTESQERLLSTLASSMGVALENARLFGETQRLLQQTNERAAELAIINSVQEGLASKLDMQAMYDLVGDKIQEIFDAQVVDIALIHSGAQTFHFAYSIERGLRDPDQGPHQLGPFGRLVADGLKPVLINDVEAWTRETGIKQHVMAGEPSKSVVFVPMMVGRDLRGYVSLQNVDHTDAFNESDVRLLTTLTSSLSVALENARLFDETKRLLGETEQRASELAIINEIGMALAEQLDFQAIVDLVGERLVSMFKTPDFFIALYDRPSNQISFPFEVDEGKRVHAEPIDFGQGLTTRVITERRAHRYATHAEQTAEGGFVGIYAEGTGRMTESWLGVPIMVGREAIGAVVLGDPAANKFTEADERLVTTVASSMGVALENARLFDETKRLLTETNERAAELAIINSVQQGLAEKLDMQAMYDLVGEKIVEIFETQVVDIAIVDPGDEKIHFPFAVERGVRLPDEPIDVQRLSPPRARHRRAPQLVGDVVEAARKYGNPVALQGEPAKSAVWVPMISGGIRGVISLQNIDTPEAFTDSDMRLLTTLASQPERRARERAALR